MPDKDDLVELTADIVAAHVGHNSVAVGDVPNLINKVHEALTGLSSSDKRSEEGKTPVASVRASIKPDHLICMEWSEAEGTQTASAVSARHDT